MKTIRTFFLVALTSALGFNAWNARAFHEFSAGVQISAAADFYVPLESHGLWVEVGSYGRCWRPARVSVGWRPYCDGYWVWTDVGWYWVSDEPWAWACYHYGRWVYDSGYGWVWAPDIEWGPAWVSWRFGGGYCGWAPLPPRVGFTVDVSPSFFVFVDVAHFHERIRPSRVIVNNTTIINNTVNITSIRRESKTFGGAGSREVFVNEGPKLAEIQKATHNKVRTEKLDAVVNRTPVPKSIQHKSSGRIETAPREQPRTRTETPSPTHQKFEPSSRSEPQRQQREEREQPKVKKVTPAPPAYPGGELNRRPEESPHVITPPDLDKSEPPRKEGIAPQPKRTLTPRRSSGRPSHSQEETGEGKGHEKGKP